MRDRTERFALLPFSMGCVSDSSVAISRPLHLPNNIPLHPPTKKFQEWMKEDEEEEEEEREEGDDKNRQPKLRKIFKNFKNFSQLFVYKEDMEEEEEEGSMMEIGHPTDVKHVTHIGLDGVATSILSNRWTPPCRMMMTTDLHHHDDIFFTTTTSPSPAKNPPPPSLTAAVHGAASPTG